MLIRYFKHFIIGYLFRSTRVVYVVANFYSLLACHRSSTNWNCRLSSNSASYFLIFSPPRSYVALLSFCSLSTDSILLFFLLLPVCLCSLFVRLSLPVGISLCIFNFPFRRVTAPWVHPFFFLCFQLSLTFRPLPRLFSPYPMLFVEKRH